MAYILDKNFINNKMGKKSALLDPPRINWWD